MDDYTYELEFLSKMQRCKICCLYYDEDECPDCVDKTEYESEDTK